MQCEDCQCDVQEAHLYTFYYSNKGRAISSRTMQYSIKGSVKALLCDDCVFYHAMWVRARSLRGAAIAMFVLACLLGIVAFINQDPTGARVVWLAAILVLAYALSLFLTSLVENRRAENQDFASLTKAVWQDRGSRLAIEVHKADLQARGYHVFFTPARLKRMQRVMTPPARPAVPTPAE